MKPLVCLAEAVIGMGLLTGVAIAQLNFPPRDPGWSAWMPKSEAETAQYDAGFSNMELGGYLDFEASCQQATELPNEQIDYRFRLNRLVSAIGTGQVEYGCWRDGQLLQTYRMTAIRKDVAWVDCLKVTPDVGSGLVVRADASVHSNRLGRVRPGQTVTPNSFPAILREAEGRDWIAIAKPIEGWVSVGVAPAGPLNLGFCHPRRHL